MLSRREALARISLLVGGSLSAPALAGLAGGCRAPDARSTYTWITLDKSEQELVAAICEAIIPETDTPGAAAAGVPQFVDLMLSRWHTDEERESLMTALDRFDAQCVSAYGVSFAACEPGQQNEALRDAASGTEGRDMFRRMKELTVVGYYTSEFGATVELQHLEVPGVFDGCVPFSEIGKSWA